jgi:large subunit ribosomal protein L25
MDKIQLKAQKRDLKTKIKQIKKQGMIPAVLYGFNTDNTPLAINSIEFEKAFRKAGESTLIELSTDDGTTRQVLVHDVQNDTLKHIPIHVDFYAPNMTEKLTATVALEYVGESMAVKSLGGTLVKVLNEVEVESLPADLPHNIEVDISTLSTFEDAIMAKDLKIPERVTLITGADETVAMVQPPRDVEAELATPVEENVEAVMAASEEPKAEDAAEEKAE